MSPIPKRTTPRRFLGEAAGSPIEPWDRSAGSGVAGAGATSTMEDSISERLLVDAERTSISTEFSIGFDVPGDEETRGQTRLRCLGRSWRHHSTALGEDVYPPSSGCVQL